jgi:hypothetical protein
MLLQLITVHSVEVFRKSDKHISFELRSTSCPHYFQPAKNNQLISSLCVQLKSGIKSVTNALEATVLKKAISIKKLTLTNGEIVCRLLQNALRNATDRCINQQTMHESNSNYDVTLIHPVTKETVARSVRGSRAALPPLSTLYSSFEEHMA